ncbi:MAG: phage tail assembly protein [Proteobacteria bacterium]|nr:phage tail assembly protein [Pseudomonadota bacterium]
MHTVELKYPVEATGETFTNLTMRRSKIKDRLLVAKMKTASDEEKEIRLFANLCEVEPKVIEELDEADYSNLQKVYLGFFNSEEMSSAQSSSSQK